MCNNDLRKEIGTLQKTLAETIEERDQCLKIQQQKKAILVNADNCSTPDCGLNDSDPTMFEPSSKRCVLGQAASLNDSTPRFLRARQSDDSDLILSGVVALAASTPKVRRSLLMRVQKIRETSLFDRLPIKKKSPGYKYKESPVRSKRERKLLPGHTCRECEEFFKASGLDSQCTHMMIQKSSRHQYKYERGGAPPGFWNPDMHTTQELHNLRSRSSKRNIFQ